MKKIVAMIAVAVSLLSMGCVEKKVLVRTDPEGAQVFIDEKPIGESPVEHPFKFYGRRLVRVGPMTNESGKVLYHETERMIETVPRWYELFPIDFFFEVLWPGTLVDTHEYTIHLPRAEKEHGPRGVESAKGIIEDAEKYRRESLSAVPENAN